MPLFISINYLSKVWWTLFLRTSLCLIWHILRSCRNSQTHYFRRNSQTHSNNLSTVTDKSFEYVWHFVGLALKRLTTKWVKEESHKSCYLILNFENLIIDSNKIHSECLSFQIEYITQMYAQSQHIHMKRCVEHSNLTDLYDHCCSAFTIP